MGVQICKALGAYVVGVCSTTNVQLVKDLGADEVVDYKTTDVTQKYRDQDFDIVFDTVGEAADVRTRILGQLRFSSMTGEGSNESWSFWIPTVRTPLLTLLSFSQIWNSRDTILKPSGNLIRIVGADNAMDTPFHLLYSEAGIGSKKVTSFLKSGPGYHLYTTFPSGEVLSKAIEQLAESDPVIDSVNEFNLPSVLAAFDKSASSRAKGKIVIKIA